MCHVTFWFLRTRPKPCPLSNYWRLRPLPPVVIVEIFKVAVSGQVDLLDLWVCPVLLIHRLKTHGGVCEYPLIGPDDLEAIVKHSLVLRDLHADNCEIPNVILELYDLLVVFRLAPPWSAPHL